MVKLFEMLNQITEYGYYDPTPDYNQGQTFNTFGGYAKKQVGKAVRNSVLGKAYKQGKAKIEQENNIKSFAKQMQNEYLDFLKTYKPQQRQQGQPGQLLGQRVRPMQQPQQPKQPAMNSESIIYEFFTPKGVSVASITAFLQQKEFNSAEIGRILQGVNDKTAAGSLGKIFDKVSREAYTSGRVNDAKTADIDSIPKSESKRDLFYKIKGEILKRLNVRPTLMTNTEIVRAAEDRRKQLTDLAIIGNEVLSNQNLREVLKSILTSLSAYQIKTKQPIDRNTLQTQNINVIKNLALIGNAYMSMNQ